MRKILITGGAGFIGSAVIRYLLEQEANVDVINVDKLTYAGNLASLATVSTDPRYRLEQHDICDAPAMQRLFRQHQPDAVLHLAAESHVDRSIEGPAAFIQTNIIGTYTLLEAAREYWSQLPAERQAAFRFQHISTDEVFGSLPANGLFSEISRYKPNSPYSASKAASDHLVRAWYKTYGLPVLVTNCSNNFGPYQFPEKLIPLMILNALQGKPLPVYGRGDQVRDWLYVEDHARALALVMRTGKVGETYNIGGHNELTNLQVVHQLCELLEELVPAHPPGCAAYRDLINNVTDRPGHDQRYAINAGKIQRELGWQPQESFATGLRKTVQWYLDNQAWCNSVQQGKYQQERLGLLKGSA